MTTRELLEEAQNLWDEYRYNLCRSHPIAAFFLALVVISLGLTLAVFVAPPLLAYLLARRLHRWTNEAPGTTSVGRCRDGARAALRHAGRRVSESARGVLGNARHVWPTLISARRQVARWSRPDRRAALHACGWVAGLTACVTLAVALHTLRTVPTLCVAITALLVVWVRYADRRPALTLLFHGNRLFADHLLAPPVVAAYHAGAWVLRFAHCPQRYPMALPVGSPLPTPRPTLRLAELKLSCVSGGARVAF